MPRFDVYRSNTGVPLVIDVQAEILSGIGSTVVIPLVHTAESSKEAMPRLKPVLRVASEEYRMITTDIAAVPTSILGERVGNLEDQRTVIIDAIDCLLQGF